MKIANIKPVLLAAFLVVLACSGCKKFLEIAPPQTELVNSSVYQNSLTATAALLGIYEKMMENNHVFANGGITLYTGLSADELGTPVYNSDYNEFYSDQLSAGNASLKGDLWGDGYGYIFQANSVLEGLSDSPLPLALKNQLQGEAKFVRAFCHFYLLNLFGNIPLVTTSDYRKNALIFQTPADSVYRQIVRDLTDAQQLLAEDYVDRNNAPTTERVRPNKWAATALLSRVYLFMKDWKDAEETAALLIGEPGKYQLSSDLDSVFLAPSPEAIWQLMPVAPNENTAEGIMFVQTQGSPLYAFLDSGFLNSFEPGDLRRSHWVGSYQDAATTYYYPAKYKIGFSADITEYCSVLRLTEQYLIRAEARNEEQDLAGAAQDLNLIRARAGLGPTTAGDYSGMQLAIEQERRHELFCEWGHRWMDLKRTGRADAILSLSKPSWQTTSALYPIPKSEIQNDPNLLQNPGY